MLLQMLLIKGKGVIALQVGNEVLESNQPLIISIDEYSQYTGFEVTQN
jgi:hypothetical protein